MDDVDKLIEQTTSPNWELRLNSAVELGRIADPRAVPVLIQLLGDPFRDSASEVSEAAVEALSRIGTAAIEALVRSLEPSPVADHWQRKWRAVALARLGTAPEAALQHLYHCLRTNDPALQEAGARALVQIGDVRAIPGLIWQLGDWPSVGRPAVEIIRDMLTMRPDWRAETIAALYAALDAPSPAASTLVPPAVRSQRRQRARAASLLQELGEPHAPLVPSWIAALEEYNDGPLRLECAERLAATGDLRALRALAELLRSPRLEIQLAGCRALARLGRTDALPYLERVERRLTGVTLDVGQEQLRSAVVAAIDYLLA